MIKAVIFDMDGVIATTSNIQSEAESEVFAKIGIKMTPEEIVKKYSGFKDIDMFQDALNQNKAIADEEKLREEKWKIVYETVEKKAISEVPGVINLIQKLEKSGYMLGVGSATNLPFIQTVLKKLNLASKFTAIASGDEVTRGKPDPAIFLLCAKKLGFNPTQCLVIEDAPGGVEAAKRAAMKVIAITTTAKKEDLKNADKIIDSFDKLTIEDIQNL